MLAQDEASVNAAKLEFDRIYQVGQVSSDGPHVDEDHQTGTIVLAALDVPRSAIVVTDENSPDIIYDFVQWTNSFTLEQIPNHQMMSWLQATVDRLLCRASTRLGRVLDIGCGTGLVLAGLLRNHDSSMTSSRKLLMDSYTGVELSSECVEHLKRRVVNYVARTALSPKDVRLFCGAAHEIRYSDPAWWDATCDASLVDTVIINSVVLYFPSLSYFAGVLDESVKHLSPNGRVFIGDVRDARLLRLFYYSINIFRSAVLEKTAEVKFLNSSEEWVRFDKMVVSDPHLLLAPIDFIKLVLQISRVPTSLLIQPKFSSFSYADALSGIETHSYDQDLLRQLCSSLDVEMSRYRFDVDMCFGKFSDSAIEVEISVAPNGTVYNALSSFAWHDAVAGETADGSISARHESTLKEFLVTLSEQNSEQEYFLFTYPHLPVLLDVLIGKAHFDGNDDLLQRLSFAVKSARVLLSPRRLLDWFQEVFPTWTVEITLHPATSEMLLIVVSTNSLVTNVCVTYLLHAERVPDNATAEQPVIHKLHSSQPTMNGKQAHFYNNADHLDNWCAELFRDLNRTKTSFPVKPLSIGAMLWLSLLRMVQNEVTRDCVCLRQVTTVSEQQLSWGQLAARVNDLAAHLATNGVREKDMVVHFVDRSAEQIVCMLAIFTIGAIYVPLAVSPNPDPPVRMAKVFDDCCPRAVLTQQTAEKHVLAALELTVNDDAKSAYVCVVDALTLATCKTSTEMLEQNLARCLAVDANDFAYCIYTSGSTSTPKAVTLTSKNFFNLLCAFHFSYDNLPSITSPNMHMLQTTAVSFDLHVYECLAPLLEPFLSSDSSCRPQLVMLRSGHLDIHEYLYVIDHAAVTSVVCTPTWLHAIAEVCESEQCWDKLKSVAFWRTGGEALKQTLVNRVVKAVCQYNPSFQMWCSYGPAECTDTATMSKCCPVHPSSADELVSLGQPLANYTAFVLVEEGHAKFRVARPGETGMIYLGGPSVFSGYLRRPELTPAVLFSVDIDNDTQTLYRTGDLGKLFVKRQHPQLHFVGRGDFTQVKIRGQRFETTEVERLLAAHSKVDHVIVCKHSEPEDFLVAYVSLWPSHRNESGGIMTELVDMCNRSLPSHMIPSSFTFVDRFLTNRNGKIDRKQLPKPERSHRITTTLDDRNEVASLRPTNSLSCEIKWLRKQLLVLLSRCVVIPGVDETLGTQITFNEPQFSLSWIELGASSLTLMRFIAKLRALVSSIAKRTCDLPSDELFVSNETQLSQMLIFSVVYKLRSINALSDAMIPFLLRRQDNKQTLALPAGREDDLVSTSHTRQFSWYDRVVLLLSSKHVLQWTIIVALIQAQRNFSLLRQWFSGNTNRRFPSGLQREPCCLQQSVVVFSEYDRGKHGAPNRKGCYNCPYVFRVSARDRLSVEEARRIVKKIEVWTRDILRSHPALRVAMFWDIDRAAQFVFDIDDPQYSHATNFREHVVSDTQPPPHFFFFSPSINDDCGNSLLHSVRVAANELMSIGDCQSMFRFHAFYGVNPCDTNSITSLHVMLNFHHSIFDGECVRILMNELEAAANNQSLRQQNEYFRYCRWVARGGVWIDQKTSVNYWKSQLQNWDPSVLTISMPPTSTPVDGVWPSGDAFTACSQKIRFMLDTPTVQSIRQLCACHNCTQHHFFMACYFVTLYCSGVRKNQSVRDHERVDMSVGTALSNRSQLDGDVLSTELCLLADTYPCILTVFPAKDTFANAVGRIQELLTKHLQHSSLPLGGICVALALDSSLRRSIFPRRSPITIPFFTAVMLYEDAEYCKPRTLPVTKELGVTLQPLDLPDFGSIFEIQLKVQELLPAHTPSGAPLSLTFEYAAELFSSCTMRQFTESYLEVLHLALKSPFATFLDFANIVVPSRTSQ